MESQVAKKADAGALATINLFGIRRGSFTLLLVLPQEKRKQK